MTANPFTFGSMIENPNRFIGRRSELTQIIDRLNGVQPQGSSVVGNRRIGKSSLLHYLVKPRSEDLLRAKKSIKLIYLDASSGECSSSPEQFRVALMYALMHQHIILPDRRYNIRNTRLIALLDNVEETRKLSWEHLSEILENLSFHPAICLDEFEALLNKEQHGFDDRFFNALRSWANDGHLSWITASKEPLGQLGQLHGLTSPFFNILATISLGPLTEAEAKQLLDQANTTRHPFDARERKILYELAKTHPYHLQVVAWKAWNLKKERQPVTYEALIKYLQKQPFPPAIYPTYHFDHINRLRQWLSSILRGGS